MFGGGRGSDRQKQTADEHSTGLNNSTDHIFTQLYSKMKSALTLVISSFFLIGVFGETVTVIVMEGDSVTLHTDLTEIHRADTIEWKLNEVRIAKISMNPSGVISVWVSPDEAFRDRLHLDRQTGDLKITKFRTTDSGQYLLKFRSTRGSSEKIFNVSVLISGVKSASVMEGDSVTLRSGVNGLQRDDVIRWRYQNILIADIINETPSIHTYNSESLKLDKQTGSLTITDITTEDAGDYEVDITITISSSSSSSKSRYTIHKSFSVNINDELKSVMEGDSFILNSGLTEIQRDNVIRWRFKKTTIAEIIKADQRFFTDDYVLDGRFRDRLKLDNRTGSLNITNIRNTDSGEYEVEISTNRFTVHKRISVTIDDELNSVSVMKGDSVTVISGLTEIQRDDEIRWRFGKTIIAEIIKADQRFSTHDGPDGRFKDRLKLDNRTGSINITNTTNTDSGVYKVEISSSRFTVHKRISVTIDETVTFVLVKEGDSVTLHTGSSEVSTNYGVLWFGDNNTRITPLPGYIDQNGQTGDLTIRNIRRNQSGDYKVIFMDIQTLFTRIHRKFHINITDSDLSSVVPDSDLFSVYPDSDLFSVDLDSDLFSVDPDSDLSPVVPDPGQSSGAEAWIVIAVLEAVAIAAAVGGLIYYRHKSSKAERSSEVNGQNHTSDKDVETELTEPPKAAEQQQFI